MEMDRMDGERITEEPDDYQEEEPISPLVADFGIHFGHVRIILCLWKYGSLNQASLARRTKISGAQVFGYIKKLEEAGIVVTQKSIANKKMVICSINDTFREIYPTYSTDVYNHWISCVEKEIVASIKEKLWYDAKALRANQELRKIMKRNNFRWKDVKKILESDEFYHSGQKVARKYGSYGNLIEKNEIEIETKQTTKELLEEAEKELEGEKS